MEQGECQPPRAEIIRQTAAGSTNATAWARQLRAACERCAQRSAWLGGEICRRAVVEVKLFIADLVAVGEAIRRREQVCRAVAIEIARRNRAREHALGIFGKAAVRRSSDDL